MKNKIHSELNSVLTKPTTSSEDVMRDGGLFPLGGTEESSKYFKI